MKKKTKFFLPFLSVLIFGILITMGSCEDTSPPPPPPPPPPLCENLIKDAGEDGIDCGGTCDPCHDVLVENEILIRHLEVVNSTEALTGDFSFGHLMERLSGEPGSTKNLILSLLTKWESPQISNGITINARPNVSNTIINDWKTNDGVPTSTPNSSWTMNLDNAPFRLLAITNRIDLQDIAKGSAGEGRLVFGLAQGGSNVFTLIFEYNLAGSTNEDVVRWAKRWHELSKLDKASPQYLAKLKDIVLLFTSDASELNQLRTNEVLGGPWEFREFKISSNAFVEVTRKQTPDIALDNSVALQQYVQTHQAELVSGNHTILETFQGNSFMAGNTQYSSSFVWSVPGFAPNSDEVTTLNTISCNGCHGGLVPGTQFTHIKPRAQPTMSTISPFMQFDILDRRVKAGVVLQQVLPAPPPAPPSATIQSIIERIKNIKRVH